MPVLLSVYTCSRTVMVIALGAGYAETCKSGSGGGSAETAGESQYGAAGSTSHIMNANTSFVILDPKGELLRDTGNLLEAKGYTIKVLDLINMEKSHCYNPFVYLRDDNDVQRLVTNLFKNTTPKGSQSNDPFWDNAAQMLLLALVFYLHYEAPPDEQNFSMVMELIRAGEVREDNEDFQSVLDEIFDRLEMQKPGHIALKYYRAYHSGSGKTLKSIQITLVSRLEKFNLESLAGMTQTDEMELWSLGEKKTAVFAVIPDNDGSFNFLVGLLYTQLFQQLYYQADVVHGGRLPVHVHFVMDEFSNVALPDEFDKLLATMRSREISVTIIIQNMAQLKALFEKQWESIVGNCDSFLYLGGNEQATHEFVSKLLGKETVDMNTFGRSRGRNGSYTTNWQLVGRELHGGVDLPAPHGTNILAAKGGTVVLSTYGSSYGNHVAISHADGSRTMYCHMSARLVSVGDTVVQGQVIGRGGSTGNSTGNHLHFELWTTSNSSSRVDPMGYF